MNEDKKKLNIVVGIKKYVRETQIEAKKVAWPNRKYVITASIIIIVMVISLSVVLTMLDYGLGQVITTLTKVRF